jgi:hypothetical protein
LSFLFFKASKTGSAAHTTSYSMAKRVRNKKQYRLKMLVGPQSRDSIFRIVITLYRVTRQKISLLYATNAYRESITNLIFFGGGGL